MYGRESSPNWTVNSDYGSFYGGPVHYSNLVTRRNQSRYLGVRMLNPTTNSEYGSFIEPAALLQPHGDYFNPYQSEYKSKYGDGLPPLTSRPSLVVPRIETRNYDDDILPPLYQSGFVTDRSKPYKEIKHRIKSGCGYENDLVREMESLPSSDNYRYSDHSSLPHLSTSPYRRQLYPDVDSVEVKLRDRSKLLMSLNEFYRRFGHHWKNYY